MESYEKALQCQNDPYAKAITQLNMGVIHSMNKSNDTAFKCYVEARDILQQIHPCPYEAITQCQGIIGNYYLTLKDYNTAEDYCCATFEMSNRISLNADHIRIQSIKALADLCNKRGMKQHAIDFCQEQLFIYEKEPFENQISIANILITIGELYDDNNDEKIRVLDRALSILKKNIHIQYAAAADCFFMIAEYYHKRNVDEKAFDHAMRALEIRRKIYPNNHSILIETQCLIDAIKSS
ncbi:unnamed protein product [Rotaria sp. Silwood2]|nr:unnamed protein product [Rotaria sp. Silwood2]